MKISDNTSVSMPMRNLLSILGATALGVWAYFGVIERLNNIETQGKLMLSDVEKNIQVDRKSWHEKIIQPFHDDTRNPENYFTTERNILLSPGKYKLFLNVQDKGSRTNWRLDEEYELKHIQHIGPILPFSNNENLTIKCI